MIIYLNDYPLTVCNDMCRQYMSRLDWKELRQLITEQRVAHFDISDTIDVFQHLELDDRYALYGYVSREYHGPWGCVAAVRKDSSAGPIINDESKFAVSMGLFDLPDTAVPPMEAIYHDGTPFGFFEALLADRFFTAFPHTSKIECINKQPEDYPEMWDVYSDLSDWRAKLVQNERGNNIYACWKHDGNLFSHINENDEIHLVHHSFCTDLKWISMAEQKENKRSIYKNHIKDDSRYYEGHHCCVSNSKSIVIAERRYLENE